MTTDHKEPAKLIEQRRLKAYADIRQRRKIARNDNSRLETFAQVILFVTVTQLVMAILYGILVVINFASKDAGDTIFKTWFLVTIVVFFLQYLPFCILGINAWWSLYEREHLKFTYSTYVPYFIILNCLLGITPYFDYIAANKCTSQWDNKLIAIMIFAVLSVQSKLFK